MGKKSPFEEGLSGLYFYKNQALEQRNMIIFINMPQKQRKNAKTIAEDAILILIIYNRF